MEEINIPKKQTPITGAASTITDDDLTTNAVMITNSNGKAAASSVVSVAELNTLNGCTSKIQTQLDAKVSKDSTWGMPDYANRVSMTTGTTTVPVNAVGYAEKVTGDDMYLTVTVDGVTVFSNRSGSSSNHASGQFLIPAGSTVKIAGNLQTAYYAPLKTS